MAAFFNDKVRWESAEFRHIRNMIEELNPVIELKIMNPPLEGESEWVRITPRIQNMVKINYILGLIADQDEENMIKHGVPLSGPIKLENNGHGLYQNYSNVPFSYVPFPTPHYHIYV